MSYDPIQIEIEKVPDPAQLDLFEEIFTSPEPQEKVVHRLAYGEVEHHIRSPDEIIQKEGDSEATNSPLVETSKELARALTARSRAISSQSKYFNPDI